MRTKPYEVVRAEENRSACVSCGTPDKVCTRQVLGRGRACCATCGYTDTHPRPDGSHDGEPCIRCGGSGVEPSPPI